MKAAKPQVLSSLRIETKSRPDRQDVSCKKLPIMGAAFVGHAAFSPNDEFGDGSKAARHDARIDPTIGRE